METKLTDSKSKKCFPRGDEHKISLPEFLQRLGVDESGLREQEAARETSGMRTQRSRRNRKGEHIK